MGARAPGQVHPAALADAAPARGERLAERAAPPRARAAAGRARGGVVPGDGAAAFTEGEGLAAFLSGERARPEAVPGWLPAPACGMHPAPSLPLACLRLAIPPNEP